MLEDVRKATGALSAVVDQASALWPKVSLALRATCEDVERRLSSHEHGVLVLGPCEPRRAFLNAALGAEALPTERESSTLVLFVRHGDRAHYLARRADGSTFEPEPDGTEAIEGRILLATEQVATALRLVAEIDAQLEAARNVAEAPRTIDDTPPRSMMSTQPATNISEVRRALFWGRRFWSWLVSTFVTLLVALGRRTAPPPDGARARLVPTPERTARMEAIFGLERRRVDAEASVGQARASAERLVGERTAYVAERRASFLSDLRRLAGAGTDAAELHVTFPRTPSSRLAPDSVLIEAPGLAFGEQDADRERLVRRSLAGCVVVPHEGQLATASGLGPIVPHLASSTDDLASLFEVLRSEATSVAAALAAAEVSGRLGSLAEGSARAEAECRERIATIERERVPDPVKFRREQLTLMAPVIEEATRRVLRSALERWSADIAKLEAEWTEAIEACADRAAVEACVASIQESANVRLVGVVDRTMDEIGRTLQARSETLQGWMLDEMSVRYKTLSALLDAAPVILGDVPEPTSSLRSVSLDAVVVAFERRRVGIGLGGVAAGAALGTLIFPGIGTAVGAFVGVLAGFLEGLTALKRDSIARIHAHLEGVAGEVAASLEAGPEGFARDLRLSLEESLDAALRQREDRILRLMELERIALVREAAKLDDVARLRATLDEHSARFAALREASSRALRELAAARPAR